MSKYYTTIHTTSPTAKDKIRGFSTSVGAVLSALRNLLEYSFPYTVLYTSEFTQELLGTN